MSYVKNAWTAAATSDGSSDSNESECFIYEQVLAHYLLINIFWNEKYAISKGNQKALNIDVDLGEEA